LDSIPVEVDYSVIALILAGLLITLVVTAIVLRKEIAKVDPNDVL